MLKYRVNQSPIISLIARRCLLPTELRGIGIRSYHFTPNRWDEKGNNKGNPIKHPFPSTPSFNPMIVRDPHALARIMVQRLPGSVIRSWKTKLETVRRNPEAKQTLIKELESDLQEILATNVDEGDSKHHIWFKRWLLNALDPSSELGVHPKRKLRNSNAPLFPLHIPPINTAKLFDEEARLAAYLFELTTPYITAFRVYLRQQTPLAEFYHIEGNEKASELPPVIQPHPDESRLYKRSLDLALKFGMQLTPQKLAALNRILETHILQAQPYLDPLLVALNSELFYELNFILSDLIHFLDVDHKRMKETTELNIEKLLFQKEKERESLIYSLTYELTNLLHDFYIQGQRVAVEEIPDAQQSHQIKTDEQLLRRQIRQVHKLQQRKNPTDLELSDASVIQLDSSHPYLDIPLDKTALRYSPRFMSSHVFEVQVQCFSKGSISPEDPAKILTIQEAKAAAAAAASTAEGTSSTSSATSSTATSTTTNTADHESEDLSRQVNSYLSSLTSTDSSSSSHTSLSELALSPLHPFPVKIPEPVQYMKDIQSRINDLIALHQAEYEQSIMVYDPPDQAMKGMDRFLPHTSFKKVLIENLPDNITVEQLKAKFAKFGLIHDVFLFLSPTSDDTLQQYHDRIKSEIAMMEKEIDSYLKPSDSSSSSSSSSSSVYQYNPSALKEFSLNDLLSARAMKPELGKKMPYYRLGPNRLSIR